MTPNQARRQRQIEAEVDAYERALPYTVTLADALSMPFCWQRNSTARKALRLEPGEIGQVNQGDVLQVVVRSATRKNAVARRLDAQLPDGWTWFDTRNRDGRFLLTAHRQEGAGD